MDDLSFIGEKEYRTFAGSSWPTYLEFQAGAKVSNVDIQQEIDHFVEMMAQSIKELTPDLEDLATANQQRQGQQFYNKQYSGSMCRIPWNTLGINSNGHAFICSSPSWIPKFVGNLIDSDNIWAVLNSETAQRIRQEIYHGRYYYCNTTICSFFSKISSVYYNTQAANEVDIVPMEFESREEYQVNAIPGNLIFDFDYTCNFKCPSCRTETINNNKHHNIRPINNRIVQRIKTEIIDRIEKQPVSIRWAGGEPFISEPYLELFEYIASSNKPNIKHIIQTNGSYLKSKSDLLIKMFPNIHELRISFDAATEETYRRIRVGGNWALLLENVAWIKQYIKQAGLPVKVTADFVVQHENYNEIPAFKLLCQELNIENINYQKMWNWGTWPSEEFHQHNVYSPKHSEYPKLIKIFQSIGKNVIE